ncbi:adenine-specific DNA-methyltransferase [Listeria monocytogenes]|uniref:adenine-specific DNA-methyltransferase n=1 Tax=Listeria monocytogenes TaxID=1639 RepID=UPI00068DC116|nr:adenine-specific DNA-methyltransferase [Listeria monocytogenes]AYY78249.1 adenine-specific DNA-methyltransferase [Listeria monocytogenes]EAC3307334.1 adenine-specific DNA-methyltransferase [Listeria monocytogenes]EAC3770650.1 adenine-specific DNA-methyltransferase [Listeria monocytogenes]EAC7071039.1 adenine-specific DNA-methyltransferase [Listeria monocytogenes]EAD1210535.1 adenine-specific DNA-methyltransferase [Listeria monocytogenes]
MLYKDFIKKDFEHMSDDNSIVLLGDSIELMKSMSTNSIDLIFADEPYNIGKDFGNNQDAWESKDDYISWNKLWISEAMRILKENGTMYLMTSTQFMPYIDIFFQENYHVLSRIIWSYDSSGVQSKKMYGSLYEPILMVTKTEKSKITFNSQDILIEAKTGAKRGLIDYRKNPPVPYNATKVPGNVWEFPRVRFKMDEYEDHPTQKPEALLERIIKASSNEGDIVFDPFGGSFSTASVAKRLGRKVISIDLNPDYYKIGLRRLGITTVYNGENLEKVKKRKTKNKSKKNREDDDVNLPAQMELI